MNKNDKVAVWILKELKKQEDGMMVRSKLWKIYSLSKEFETGETSVLISNVCKNLLNNGKIEVIFVEGKKCFKLRS
jgi:hypothetical protein